MNNGFTLSKKSCLMMMSPTVLINRTKLDVCKSSSFKEVITDRIALYVVD